MPSRSATGGTSSRNFAQAAGKEVAVHSGCRATASRVRKVDGGKTTTLARWHQVHDLLDAGVGLGECAGG